MRSPRPRYIDPGTEAVWSLLAAAGGGGRGSKRGASVRFIESPPQDSTSVLEVTHGGHPGTLQKVRAALFNLRIQVVRGEAGAGGSPVERVRIAEFDGGPIGKRRQAEVCITLMTLLAS